MTIIRQLSSVALLLGSVILALSSTARAQQIAPHSYLFVEVRETTGRPVSDATIKVTTPDGKEMLADKTRKEGNLSGGFFHHYDHHYDVEVTKPGYQPYHQVIFPATPGEKLVALIENFPSEANGNYFKGPPLKVRLVEDSSERRTNLVEDPNRLLLLAVKRADAVKVGELLKSGANVNAADSQGVPAIAWAAFAGDPETIKLLLEAKANVRNRDSLAHEALLIYLAEGMARGRYSRRGTRSVDDKEWPAQQADIVHRMIAAGADVNARNSYRGTVLTKAITHVSYSLALETIRELISKKASVVAADDYGQTPLMLAASNSETELVNMLLEAGAKPSLNAKDKAGRTALINAAGSFRASSLPIMRTLLGSGAKVNEANEDGATALMLAAKSASVERVETLLKSGATASVNAKDKRGLPALIYAITGYGQSEIELIKTVKALLAAGAHVNEVDETGRTALMHLAEGYRTGMTELVQTLIDAGANVKTANNDGQTPLMLAAKANAIDTVKVLLQKGAGDSVNAKDQKGATALLVAVAGYGNDAANMTRVLLAAGANVNDVNEDGQTPLIVAALKNSGPVLSLLLAAHAEINTQDKSGQTALMHAYEYHAAEAVKVLREAGASINGVDQYGRTALMIAVGGEYSQPLVRELLETDAKASVNAKDKSGQTALFHATYYDPEIVKALLAAGANVNEVDNNGRTALMNATNGWRDSALEMVKAMLAAGADVNAADSQGRTALLNLAKDRDKSPMILRALLDAGANINLADATGQTPLMNLAQAPSPEMLQMAIDAGASINARDKDGRSALSYSISGGSGLVPPKVRALIAAGANVNAGDSSGVTPLMLAARAESLELVKALLHAGAVVDAKDNQGQTALMHVVSESNYRDSTTEVVSELLQSKAHFNAVDHSGRTPLMMAAKTGYGKLVQLLLASGASVNAQDAVGQSALLHAAGESGYSTSEAIKLLLAAKANVNDVNHRKQTALMLAALRGNLESVTMLIDAGAAINIKDEDGLTPMLYAAWGGNEPAFDIITALLKAGAKTDDVSRDGETGLMLAAWHSTVHVMQIFLTARASVNARNKRGETALMYATKRNGDHGVANVKLLLKSGADVSVTNKDGQTAIAIARARGEQAIVKVLEEYHKRP